jgi:hypothetical protein
MKRRQMDQAPYLLDRAPDRKRSARHGSTRWLWKDEDVQKAIGYVVSQQGEAMEVHRVELP